MDWIPVLNITGASMKYRHIIELLEEDVLYTSGSIASFAAELGLLPKEDLVKSRRRMRIALASYVTAHRFPDEGDGIVFVKGQSATPGWYGWRWKASMHL